MALTWPIDCNTPAERTEYYYRAQELLRLLHNKMGYWYNNVITETQYNNQFPLKIRQRYPYAPQLTAAQWRDFTDNVFEPISKKIIEKLLQNRELLKASVTWSIDVEDI